MSVQRASRRPVRSSSAHPVTRRGPGRPTRSDAELLEIALALFVEHGYEGASIDAISAAAGMAKRTVYARYADKTQLFAAALERAIDAWILPVTQLAALETDDFETSLQRIGQRLVENVLSDEGLRLLRLTNAQSARFPALGTLSVRRGTEPTLAFLADLLTRRGGIDAGVAADAAQAFLHLVVGGPANNAAWGISIDAAALRQHTQFSVRLFLHGIAKPALDTRAAPSALRETLDEASRQIDGLRGLIERSSALVGG